MTGPFYLAGKEWLLPAAVVLLIGTALVVWAYYRAPTDGKVRGLCIGLKILGLLLLLICLVDPMTSAERAKPGANLLALVADNSEGLTLTDSGEKESRGEHLQNLLKPDADNWQAKLDNDFEVKRYAFDTHLKNLDNFAALKFDGPASRLGEVLRTLARRYRGQPLAGVVIFTDGVATDIGEELPSFVGLPPVYPVIVGDKPPKRDVAVEKVTPTQTAFEDAPVTITAQVSAIGCADEDITARLELLTTGGKAALVRQRTLTAGEDNSRLTFRFEVRPAVRGVLFYRVTVSASGDDADAVQANNSRVAVVDRGGGPYRVLYVSGRANWEFKFLKRALDEDEQVDLVGLIRIAKREPKFAFKSRTSENTNPLFRGSGQGDQDYDKPVLVRLNTRDTDELKTGFPAEEKELFAYSAVVIDDLEAKFFTPSQHALLHKYVSERGGGLLMLGGQESFRQGKYDRTPLGSLLPVYLNRPGDVKPLDNLRLTITRAGWLQPWVRLRDNETDERDRLESMTEFVSLNRVRGKKPGATVMATVHTPSDATEHPALVTHKFGRGRVAAMLLGDVWRWGLKNTEQHEDMDKAWRQMIRWLVSDVPAPFELSASQTGGATGHSLTLTARDENHQPLDNAQVSIRVRPVGGTNSIPLHAEPTTDNAGVYQSHFIPRQNGGYLASAEVRDEAGKLLGTTHAGWSTDFAAAEYRSLEPNRALLAKIAQQTDGRIIELDELEEFAAELPAERAPVTELQHFPLWHQATIFLIALACFAAEWFLRRRKGLP